MGCSAVIYLVAVSGIGQDMYEAAEIDGAIRWQRIWRMTLPTLKRINCLASEEGQHLLM